MRIFVVVAASVLLTGCSWKRSPEERAMTPQDSLKAMRLSEDFHVELFVAEPDVMSPVEMAFDENGKLYVAEMLDYPDDPPAGKPARSRIRLLENPNGDGRTWRSKVFAENVLAVSGFMPWKGGLIVTSAPDILFLKDTDGDGKADVREVLFTGFPKVNQEARITNPRLAVDNWIYCSNSGSDGRITSPRHPEMAPVLVRGADFRFDPISGRGEAASGAAQFGSTIDDFGHRFISQNTTHIRHVVVPMKYLARAPLLEVQAVAQDISDHGRPSGRMYPLTGPQDWRKQRTAIRQHRHKENKSNYIEQLSGWFTAASGGTLYDGDAFPPGYAGSVFTGDVSGNLIHRDTIRPDGATFAAHRAIDNVEFLASTDVWFRPCNFANAPDGNLYFTDIYRQVIETPESIPEEIRKKINFYNGDTLGRIYRIVANQPRRKGDLKSNLGGASSGDLVKLLENPNGWHRQTAHRLLLERQDRSVVADLKRLAQSGTTPEARVHALWLLQAFGGLEAALVASAMKDSDSRVRVQALQLSEGFLKDAALLGAGWTALAADPDPQVRFQTALTLGYWKDRRAMALLASLAHSDSSDAWFRIAILSSVADEAAPFFQMLLAKGEKWVQPQLLIQTSSMIGSRQNPAELSAWLAALPKVSQPEQYLAGLTRGLKLVGARNLRVAGAEQALSRMLSSENEAVQRAAWEASRYFELSTLIQRARQDALSAKLSTELRIRAVRALRGGHFASVAPVLASVLESHPPQQIESAAVDALAAFDERDAGRIILEHWRGYSPAARQRAVSAMLATRDRIPLLLNAVENGVVERSAMDATARSHLYDDPDQAIAAKARKLLETTSDRAKVVASYMDAVNLQGDVARGKKLFEENCGRCHEARRQAGRVGPDLSGINNKTKEELITSILNPSYAIEPRFVNYVITTTDGRMYDGIISNETTWAITLRGGAEEDETILRKNISSVRASSVSLMPDELEKNLGKQGLADVIAYLRGGL